MALSANERRIVELVLKATGDAELKRITAELRATREAAQGSQKALGGMQAGLGSVTKFAAGFIGALGVQTLIAWTRAIFEAADALDAAAEQAGIGVERYQELKEAFRALEVDGKKFETGMERLASTLSDVLAGDTGKATQALEDLGIATKIYSGEIRTTDELVDALAASQKAMGDDMKFTSDIVDILGRKLGVDFANALKDGKLAAEEMALAQEGFNVVTADQIEVLADAQEAFDRFKTDATNSVLSMVADSIAGFKTFGSAFWDFVNGVVEGQGIIASARGAASRSLDQMDRDIKNRLARNNPDAWWAGGDGVDRTVVTPPRTTRAGGGGGSSGADAAAKAEADRVQRRLGEQADLMEKNRQAFIKEQKAADDAANALQDWANAINGAADPLIALNAEMDKLLANEGKLSDAGFEYEFQRITTAINDAQNAMAENSGEWAAHQKTLEAHAAAAEEIRAAWEYTAEAFAQATYDIISGSMKIGQAVKKMVASILSEVARIAAVKLAAQIVGSLFGAPGVGKSAGTAGTGSLKLFANAMGGVTTGPVAFAQGGGIGIAGEAGPEMIAPLRRDSAGRMGVGAVAPKVVVNNYAGADVGVTQTSEGVQIDIVRRAIANDIRRGGNSVAAAIEGTYRVGRQSQAFG